jgi:Na+/H+ antiporter NhaD/arsenite permease-like protein
VVVTTFLPAARIAPTHKTLLSGLAALDWIGSFFLLGSVTTLILGFSFHTSFIKPWSSPLVWGNLLASVVALVTFVYVERRVENPVVPLSLLKSRHRTAIMASGFFLSIYNQAFVSTQAV